MDRPRRVLLGRCIPALLAGCGLPALAQQERADPRVAAQGIVRRSNEFRRSQRLSTLTESSELARAAQRFAEFMAAGDRYGHRADGREPQDRARAAGYDDCIVAENIAWRVRSSGFESEELAAGFVDGWQRSPPHRANLLDPDVSETGVALARSVKSGRWYAVQMFGRPGSQRIEFAVANRSPQTVAYEVDGARFDLRPRVTRTHEQCRPPRLSFRLPGSAAPLTASPRNGDRLEVVAEGGRLALRRRAGA